ncbi:tRNA (adenosine(37)-N6)-threonylcarbamoyltransferase complex dimerization subunit type 1 TsaB [Xenophilus arseniciresistens]|uniref:tRNA (Adenosine(37)-N6)-threonylcarbamoyltransferase complex dimerization subunit type 1 TsaB n=1 Tax=Xenophilus arseniciresistens TaxID=1283306 RepID=A0AAE3T2M1_9BURK|nr:tRNA (adenosine(37)-N6)-threonylcarbamoyltransferase complex dimerization subunit type 1 TsaB [Xenophilus arseniciresistens]MDA7419211.1 tRNA (adenosine(37)-N6)-threonylcarbamoyltransferase complex dimerization subunit type 1 TsaB [Xenophilus arseniciresistens]
MPELLAFDTSTEVLSIAVQRGDAVLARTEAGGAQASATLIPLVQQLLAEAGLTLSALDAICFGRGPGAFTGLRTACAVAQGLGFGSGRPLLPIDTLQAVAEEAHALCGATRVLALLDARMDEVYAQAWTRDAQGLWHAAPGDAGQARLMSPEQVQAPAQTGWVLAGNAFTAYGQRLPAAPARQSALPTAGALLRLAPALLAAGAAVPPEAAWPLYVRDKVAQTTAERMAVKAAATATP